MKRVKASATVEMAFMMPVILLSFMAAVYILFYFHDKNIISGAAYETAVVGVQKVKWDEENLEEQLQKLFRERVRGKMIFFAGAEAEVEISEKTVSVTARARKKGMTVSTEQRQSVIKPEKYIRDLRRITNGS